MCVNTVGSHRCERIGNTCPPGLEFDAEEDECLDIDECSTRSPCPEPRGLPKLF